MENQIKPALTEVRKQKFTNAFKKIVEGATENVKKIKYKITWPTYLPNCSSNTRFHLKGNSREEFVGLINQLKCGMI